MYKSFNFLSPWCFVEVFCFPISASLILWQYISEKLLNYGSQEIHLWGIANLWWYIYPHLVTGKQGIETCVTLCQEKWFCFSGVSITDVPQNYPCQPLHIWQHCNAVRMTALFFIELECLVISCICTGRGKQVGFQGLLGLDSFYIVLH